MLYPVVKNYHHDYTRPRQEGIPGGDVLVKGSCGEVLAEGAVEVVGPLSGDCILFRLQGNQGYVNTITPRRDKQ